MNKTINKRCVVTGLGMINAIGNNVEESWTNALAGTCGIAPVKSVNAEECYANQGAEVDCPELEKYIGVDRVSQLCLKAVDEAVADAALDMSKEDAARVGVIMGSCVGGVVSVENYIEKGEKTEDIRKMTISSIANHAASRIGAEGVVTNVGNACAASTISVGYACELIREGVGDVFLVGGADAFASVPYAGFIALHAISEGPCSPFNHSNGISLGEGAGVLVVESYEHAVSRGAKIYCDVLSTGVSSDAHHITAPREDGVGQMFALRTAMKNSGIEPAEIGYVNAHGTGTGKNDGSEFYSLHTIFDEAGGDLSVSSTKSMVGHCLGAAGAIEAIYSVKALTENKVPPTVGYSEEDLAVLEEKAGKIDFIPNKSHEKKLDYVMSNSFAFGGSNASVIFGAGEGNVKETESDEPIYITGFGMITPMGNGVENYITKVNAGEVAEGASHTASVQKEDYDKFDVKMAFYRKLDNFSTMQVVSGLEALAEAKMEVTEENCESIGAIIGTGDGPISTVYEFQQHITENGTKSGSAFNFPNTVYNAAGGYLSIKTGIRGVDVTVTNGAQSGLSSLCYAYNEIRQNHAKFMLATGTDENTEILEKLYGQLGQISAEKAVPYLTGKGMNLSSASISMAVERGADADARGVKKYAKVAGYGMTHATCEYGNITGTEAALEKAIEKALADANISAADIDAIYGFGNGLEQVDTIEKNVYSKSFAKVPVHNVRDVIGEARAASCALSAAHAALTLSGEISADQKAYLFENGAVTEQKVATASYRNVLVTSVAEGGSYCAVVLQKA